MFYLWPGVEYPFTFPSLVSLFCVLFVRILFIFWNKNRYHPYFLQDVESMKWLVGGDGFSETCSPCLL